MSDEPADWPTGRALLPCDNNTGSGNMSGTKDWGQEERGAVELADAFDRLAEVIGKSAYHPDDRFANTPSKPPTRDEISRASTLINEVDDVCDMRILRPVLARTVEEGCWLQVWLWVPNVIRRRDDSDEEEC